MDALKNGRPNPKLIMSMNSTDFIEMVLHENGVLTPLIPLPVMSNRDLHKTSLSLHSQIHSIHIDDLYPLPKVDMISPFEQDNGTKAIELDPEMTTIIRNEPNNKLDCVVSDSPVSTNLLRMLINRIGK